MDLRQLEYLVAVAEERSFTRAAARVHVSQSGVSAQVRQLERELGAELFDRTSRVVALTAAGEVALEHARAALASAAALGQAVGEVAGVVRGSLVVGMVAGCALTPLFDALAAFHRAHPGVRLRLLEGVSEGLVDEVRRGGLDLALVGVAQPPEGLEVAVVVDDPLVALVPEGHPVASGADPFAHPLVAMPRGTGLRAALDARCAASGERPEVVLEASAPDAVAALAARGLGVAVLGASMAPAYPDLVAAPIPDTRALLALVWRDRASPAARALLGIIRNNSFSVD
ncbi:LysR family transcriptional regulator [Actinosynnema pretiosum subsp. pretiosum]|uniref:Transcriptional regulator, LysR family n=2 Tax=Actinosynnema TaxID=40566 RepID=C6WRX8_ACTMD|nr:LysR family transcriptional regulator [Actinosynnema mirum]ACU36970.1 transcriptional regulator, LysR family [Actinosynnema mirum DSM 43827]AXX30450.1 putative LysR-family transcriptional regulator [Actinosynnema pretiosum subsp. pretiosum]QUF05405.1 LysR family transcriptional regulator [Actinosynnema pretiosum subsp. pretiosum]